MEYKLNEQQMQAVSHFQGPCMVIAAPGSGKTGVLTKRIKHLIDAHHVTPSEILVITFTRAAAAEMQKRFLALCEGTHPPVTFGTFHAVFYAILRETSVCRSGSILSEQEKKKILRDIIRKNRYDISPHGDMLEELTGEIGRFKNRTDLGGPESGEAFVPGSIPPGLFFAIYRDFKEATEILGKVDFDDMALKCGELFRERPEILRQYQARYRYLLIDEFQDIAPGQYSLVRQLAAPEDNLFIVGDDDQSIYGFRGARPDIMKNFPTDFPGTAIVTLQTNYRSTPEIVETAKKLISHNRIRYEKDSRAEKGHGSPVRLEPCESPERMEAALLDKLFLEKEAGTLAQCAVIARTSGKFPLLAEKCRQAGIPCHFREKVKSLFESEIVEDLLAYLEFSRTPPEKRERRQFFRIMNRPLRYISREAVDERADFGHMMQFYRGRPGLQESIQRLWEDLGRIRRMPVFLAVDYIRKVMGYDGYLLEKEIGKEGRDILAEADLIQESAKGCPDLARWRETLEARREEDAGQEGQAPAEGVTFCTMHAAKGLEYEKVFLIDCNEGITPHKKACSEAEIEEERRMFYVGMTRAKKELTLLYVEPGTQTTEGVPARPVLPSRFLGELQ